MHRDERLRRSQDFAAVHRQGRAVSGDLLVVRTRHNDLHHNRYGFSIGKRVGKAVVRNRVKRRLRAAISALVPRTTREREAAPTGWDVVIIARAPAATVDYDELVRALAHLFRRARLTEFTAEARGHGGREAKDGRE